MYEIDATLEGYTAVGVVGFETDYPYNITVNKILIKPEQNTVIATVKNFNNIQLENYLTAYVLYVKN